MTSIEQGSIDIWIDKIIPCLRDTQTGEIRETVVLSRVFEEILEK